MKLSDKELRRINLTKPGTVKRMMYALMYIGRLGISLKEFSERKSNASTKI